MSKMICILLVSVGMTVGINDAFAKPGKGKGKAKGHAHAPGLAKQAGKQNQGKAQQGNHAALRAQHKKQHGNCQCQICDTQLGAGGDLPIDQVDGTKPGKEVGLRGNNGVGNGLDPLPRGNPRENDGDGAAPGAPGNKKGQGIKGGAGKTEQGRKGGKPDHAGNGKGGKTDKAQGGGNGKGGPKR